MKPGPRLYVLLARAAPRALIFRRGPSKLVQLVYWRTDSDAFFFGQWFKGRIYERRCDLSPNGELLVYFAASQRLPYGAWTAVSRPPFLTALALWPKGDWRGGGGVFADDRHILLDHYSYETPKLADGFELPSRIRVAPLLWGPSAGEDGRRLERDGWKLFRKRKEIEQCLGASPLARPESLTNLKKVSRILEKASPNADVPGRLQQIDFKTREPGGPGQITEYAIYDHLNRRRSLGRADWADWDRNGDLFLAREGQIFRLSPRQFSVEEPLADAKQLVDLRGEVFYPLAASEEAKDWFAVFVRTKRPGSNS